MKLKLIGLLLIGFRVWGQQYIPPTGGGGSLPSTPGVTVCTGTPCTAWGTSLTAPPGQIVGLQSSTPGTQQTGNLNISGTGIFGAGSANSPALLFTGTNAGLYAAANEIAFAFSSGTYVYIGAGGLGLVANSGAWLSDGTSGVVRVGKTADSITGQITATAMTLGTVTPTGSLTIAIAPTATANYGLVSFGSGPFDGSTTGYFTGSSAGTAIAVNLASGSTADLMNLQVAGTPLIRADYTGGFAVHSNVGVLANNSISSGVFDVLLGNNGASLGSGGYLTWASTSNANGIRDTRFTRAGAGIVSLDTTANGNALGSLQLTNLTASGYLSLTSAAAATVSANQVSFGATTAAVSNCGSLATACLVINVGGTTRYIPYF